MSKATRSTAYHEAGHAVAAHALGLGTVAVSVEPKGDAIGWHQMPDANVDHLNSAMRVLAHLEIPGLGDCRFETDDEAAAVLRQHLLLIQGGEVAQRRAVPTSYRHHHVDSDHGHIIDLALLLTGGNPDAVEVLDAELRAEAERLLDKHWASVEAVAAALLEHGSLTGAQVAAIVNERSEA